MYRPEACNGAEAKNSRKKEQPAKCGDKGKLGEKPKGNKCGRKPVVPDHVEGLVKNIEKKGIDKKEEDEAQQGDKSRREEGSTPEELKRASKILMGKSSGGSKIAAPTKIQSPIM